MIVFTPNTVIGSAEVNSNFDDLDKGLNHCPYKMRAYRNASQTLADITWTKIQLNLESYDTNSNFDNVTNYRYTVPVTGYYLVTGAVYGTGATLSAAAVAIYKGGVRIAMGDFFYGADAGAAAAVVTDVIYLIADEYIELWAYGNVAAGSFTVAGGAADLTYMSVHLLST